MEMYSFKRKDGNTYSQKEIDSNINTLSDAMEDYKLQRKELNNQIRHLKKQVEYWEELDLKQTRIC